MENSDNKFKIYKAVTAMSIFLVVLVSVSFGFFTNQRYLGTIGGGIASVFDIDLVVPDNGVIVADNMMPIMPIDVEANAQTALFQVVTGDNVNFVYYTLSLVDLAISNNLQVDAFRWELRCLDNTSRGTSGTFAGVNNSMIILDEMDILPNTVHNFEFRMWIQSEGLPQNELRGGTFTGRFSITAHMIQIEDPLIGAPAFP